MPVAQPDREYYRKLSRKCRRFRVNIAAKQWCDLWHQHFDWDGLGNFGWRHRRKHLAALLEALRRARVELASSTQPYQLFALVHPRSSGDDAVYVHTPNPNGSAFPCTFAGASEVRHLPPLLAGKVDLTQYEVSAMPSQEGSYFVIQPRSGNLTSPSSGQPPAAAHVER